MPDKRVGKRFQECRKKMGLTQAQLEDQLGRSDGYISTIERGAAFPEYDNFITILNILKASPDMILCDVLDHVTVQRTSQLSESLQGLPPKDQKRILDTMEFLIKQAQEEE